MMKVWFNVLPEQRKDTVNEKIKRAWVPNVMLHFRKETEVHTAYLKSQNHVHLNINIWTQYVVQLSAVEETHHCHSYIKQRSK